MRANQVCIPVCRASQAFTSIGDGPYSDDVYCKTNEDVPGPPASVKAAVAASDAVIVSWREPLAPNGVVRSYTVFRKASHDEPAVTFTVPRHMRYHKASGLVVGKRYNFWVSASTGAGEGAASSIVAQTVSEQGNYFYSLLTASEHIKSALSLFHRCLLIPPSNARHKARCAQCTQRSAQCGRKGSRKGH